MRKKSYKVKVKKSEDLKKLLECIFCGSKREFSISGEGYVCKICGVWSPKGKEKGDYDENSKTQ